MLRKIERLGFQELKAFLAGRHRPSSAQLSYNTNSSFSRNIFSAEAAGLCEETTGAAGLLFLCAAASAFLQYFISEERFPLSPYVWNLRFQLSCLVNTYTFSEKEG